jgi:membrane protein YdbS with pleckstrin-like domain
VDPSYVDLQKRVGWITVGVLAAIGFFAAPLALVFGASLIELGIGAVAGLGLLALLAWVLQRWPALDYRHLSYRVDQAGLEIRRGVFWRRVINVPRSRIQHTDVSQGPVERQYGLGTLAIHTAGTEHARVELPGLRHDVALAIRDHLLPRDLIDVI